MCCVALSPKRAMPAFHICASVNCLVGTLPYNGSWWTLVRWRALIRSVSHDVCTHTHTYSLSHSHTHTYNTGYTGCASTLAKRTGVGAHTHQHRRAQPGDLLCTRGKTIYAHLCTSHPCRWFVQYVDSSTLAIECLVC